MRRKGSLARCLREPKKHNTSLTSPKISLSAEAEERPPEHAFPSASGWHPREGRGMPSTRPNAISYTVHTIVPSGSGASRWGPRVWDQVSRILHDPGQRGVPCSSAAFRRNLFRFRRAGETWLRRPFRATFGKHQPPRKCMLQRRDNRIWFWITSPSPCAPHAFGNHLRQKGELHLHPNHSGCPCRSLTAHRQGLIIFLFESEQTPHGLCFPSFSSVQDG